MIVQQVIAHIRGVEPGILTAQHPRKSRCRAADDPRLVLQEHKNLAALTGSIHIALDRHAPIRGLVRLGIAAATGPFDRPSHHRRAVRIELLQSQTSGCAAHAVHSVLDAFFHSKHRTANVDLEADGSALMADDSGFHGRQHLSVTDDNEQYRL